MLMVTAANGRTGRAVVHALAQRGAEVRAFVRSAEQGAALMAVGAADVAVGDLQDAESLATAVRGCTGVVHIGPPMHPDEVAITERVLTAALDAGADRFIYYSVLHPEIRSVRHHALKLEVTEQLVARDIGWTIVEPSRYMQHLEPIWPSVVRDGVHAMPFSVDVRFSVVDLLDLAAAVAHVATEPGHVHATYELAGPEALSQRDMARIIGEVLGRPIEARAIPLDEMAAAATARGLPADRVEQMRRMNAHYDHAGLLGNPNVLRWLLGREATTFAEYVRRLASASTVAP